MTSKEIINKTLRFEDTQKVPFAVLDGHTWICKRHGLSVKGILELPDAGAQITVDAYRAMGSEMMFSGTEMLFPAISAMGGVVDDDVVGAASEILERPIKEPKDIENFDLAQCVENEKASMAYIRSQEQVRNMRTIVGPDVHLSVATYGAFTIASQMIGVEDFMYEIVDDEEGYCEKMIDFAAELVNVFVEGMIEAGCDSVFLCEPVASGDLIGQSMFEEYVLPINEKMMERLSATGAHVFMHICGNTTARVPSLAKSKAELFSVDSIDMVKASEEADGKMVMFGNLSPAGIVLQKDAQGVYEAASALLETMRGRKGFILAPGCDLPPDTPLENIQAMAKAVADFK